MGKSCQWGLCKSDSRYPDKLERGIIFIPFAKPKSDLEKCLRWIKACGRPHDQLNVDKINKDKYICSKHFVEIVHGGPSHRFPDPLPACSPGSPKAFRKPPKKRKLVSPQVQYERPPNTEELEIGLTESLFPGAVEMDIAVDEKDSEIFSFNSNLDLLALAAENRRLKEENDALRQHLTKTESLLRQAERKPTESIATQMPVPKKTGLTLEILRNQCIQGSMKSYTGFSYEDFVKVFNFLLPDPEVCPFKTMKKKKASRCMPLTDQFLLTIMKLRLNLSFVVLANTFHLSSFTAGQLFRNWINYMYFRFGCLSVWPHRDVIISNMPKGFKNDFGQTLIILDGTEIKTNRPRSLRSQSQMYSDYKSSSTLKGLVGVDPCGAFIIISMLFSGSISDKEITQRSGFYEVVQDLMSDDKIKPGDGIMVDKGLLIANEVDNLGLKLLIPPFVTGGGQMSSCQVSFTKKIARHRIVVENAIGRAKKFKIIDQKMDFGIFPTINQIFFVYCFLTNFMPPLYK